MRLGEYDEKGRRDIEGTGEKVQLLFDTVIGAVGARVETEIFSANGIALNDRGFPKMGPGGECSLPGVYIAGDCKAGPATVVKAIADGKNAAADILKKLEIEADFAADAGTLPGMESAESGAYTGSREPNLTDLYFKKGVIAEAKPDSADAYRCLSCGSLCEICVDVCPNRANVTVEAARSLTGSAGKHQEEKHQEKKHQIVHIDRMCNECGNCAVFCPHPGKPYKDKLTIFSSAEDFTDSENPGFLKTGAEAYKIRFEDKSVVDYHKGEKNIPGAWSIMIETIAEKYEYLLGREKL
jgi:putative selenate reductase